MNETQATVAKSAATARRLVDLGACIEHLEATGNLLRVRSKVDPRHELAGIAKRFEGRQCILFERIKGSAHPITDRTTMEPRDCRIAVRYVQAASTLRDCRRHWLLAEKPVGLFLNILKHAPANEVVDEIVDLDQLPIPVHALKDGGRYLDSSLVIARNPITGMPNVSIHRMMVTKRD